MPIEIERKFTVKEELLPDLSEPSKIYQTYISSNESSIVRVRIKDGNPILGIKSRTDGISRLEFEYNIPKSDALDMISNMAISETIEKDRYKIGFGNLIWELDIYGGKNSGLIIAEVELPSIDFEFTKPDWVSEEVTGDKRYSNSNLATSPFTSWNL